MPFFDYFNLVNANNFYGFAQIGGFYASVFDERNFWFNAYFGAPIAILDVHMNGQMFVGIEKEAQSKNGK